MVLSSTSPQGPTTNRLLNKLQYAMTNIADDITTATTSDILVMLDADADYAPKYADSANVFELLGITASADELNAAADLSAAQRAVTATADGLTTGLLTTADFGKFLTITSANAAHIVVLPAAGAAYVGGVIEMWVGANGFELRADGTAATINGLDCKTTNEAAIAATHRVRATLVAAETWLLEGDTELGARVTIVPDAV